MNIKEITYAVKDMEKAAKQKKAFDDFLLELNVEADYEKRIALVSTLLSARGDIDDNMPGAILITFEEQLEGLTATDLEWQHKWDNAVHEIRDRIQYDYEFAVCNLQECLREIDPEITISASILYP